ncbi:sigma-70 family RNA polymerase sigma factor [Blastococcus xanthinilyticus]|uniref:DNA-directed RNA polymerase specialized sigma24 family protein n=1 Tax=Blastococcus xanthinilyticus TaxID=1564164 RepID=A0A5S5CWF5_9ACTN|nr:sigma-70 family RNA polymerase sigma factor [Blastococcus xanthinilyticus]TYP87434.1 DNA-directed RNA polymerase specialized sigma24 family protein [Blastococcus xanthinilyticus]
MSEAEGRLPRRSAVSATAPAHIRPDKGIQHDKPASVPKDWLDEYNHTEHARSLARLEADTDLVTHLALQGFAGRDFDVFNTELAKYGSDVLTGWLVTGRMFGKIKERGFGGLPSPPDDQLRDRDTIDELVGETVAKALVHFRRDVLLERRWTATKGATLRTFFIGQCLIRFANVYRTWWAKEMRASRVTIDDPVELQKLDRSAIESPEQHTIDQQEVERILRKVTDPRVKRALVYAAWGWQQWEIAQRLGVTEKAVERMLANNRDRLKKLGVVA